jgi:hypothetical protein
LSQRHWAWCREGPLPSLWEDLLNEYGFTVTAIDILKAPDPDNPVVCQLLRAVRRKAASPPSTRHASPSANGQAPEHEREDRGTTP